MDVNLKFGAANDEQLRKLKRALDLQLRSSQQIIALGERIMTVVSDFNATSGATLQRIEASQAVQALAQASTAMDITEMKAEIARLQQSSGEVPLEDQQILSDLQTRMEAVAVAAEAAAVQAKAIDAMTDPKP